VANAVDDEDLGIAGATQQLFSHVGTAVGMNLLETVQVAARPSAGLGGSYRLAFAVGTGVSLVGLVLATVMDEPTRTRRRFVTRTRVGAPEGAPQPVAVDGATPRRVTP